METVLADEEEEQMKLLRTLGVDSEIIDVLFIQELYHNLKAAIKEICTGLDDGRHFMIMISMAKIRCFRLLEIRILRNFLRICRRWQRWL